MPYRKPQHELGTGIVGLDLGPSTIAVVAQQAALLQPFCPEVAPDAQALRRLERKLDRQRRARNPLKYHERGRGETGCNTWPVSAPPRQGHGRRRAGPRKTAVSLTRRRSQPGPPL